MPPRRRSASFLLDLFAQLHSARARIDAGRYCAYDGFLGRLLLGGALALRLSGPPDPLGAGGFALVVASAVVLLAAFVIPVMRPRLVPALLAAEGLVILALTVGFALACTAWALATPATGTFRYVPGLIVVGTTHGAALWADFGPPRAHPRPWRLAGFITGLLRAERSSAQTQTDAVHDANRKFLTDAASEANGFPEWLVGIAKAKPEIVEQTLAGTIVADYEYDEHGASPYGVLAKLPYAALEGQQACFPVLRRLLESKDPPKVDALSKALAVVLAPGHATLSDGLFERRCVSTSSAPQHFAIWWGSRLAPAEHAAALARSHSR